MAYNVSDEFRTQCYSGEAIYSCRLLINDVQVPIEQIAKIEINSPIIDNTNQSNSLFYIGSFISQSITIKFKNLDGLDIKGGNNVDLYISQYVDDDWEEVPIGKYLIDDLKENYQQTCEITCLDYAIKFSSNCDYLEALGEDGKIEIDELLEWICDHYEVELGNYPNTNGNVEISTYDNTLSGKYYISCIAEIKGCNAKMDRDGSLTLVPLKSSPIVTVDALKSASWELGEKYEIEKVVYFDAIRNFTFGGGKHNLKYGNNNLTYNSGGTTYNLVYEVGEDNEYNTLYIRQDNPFIVDENVVENIYNVVYGFEAYNLKCKNLGDISLDAWDIINYTLGDKTYPTLNNNKITYEITIMSEVEVKISTTQKEVTTNVVGGTQEQKIRKLGTEINNIDGTITLLTQTTLPDMDRRINLTMTEEDIRTLVSTTQQTIEGEISTQASATLSEAGLLVNNLKSEIDNDGVTKVSNSLVTIDVKGIKTEKDGETFSTQITNKSFEVYDGDTELSFMGYDGQLGKTIARIKELETEKITMGYHRAEPMESENRTGWFYVGGGN